MQDTRPGLHIAEIRHKIQYNKKPDKLHFSVRFLYQENSRSNFYLNRYI